MTTQWTINSSQSDVLIKTRHSSTSYLAGATHQFKGHIAIENDEIEDVEIEFSLDVNNKDTKPEQTDSSLKTDPFLDISEYPSISFKSTSFQKINKNINFLKGNLTIQNITKVVELDAELIDINDYNGDRKAAFEITGAINRKDFGLSSNSFNQIGGLATGQDIKLIANLEFAV
jgi:polyisoprenoid-binding protein YceI